MQRYFQSLLRSSLIVGLILMPLVSQAGYTPQPIEFDPNHNVERNTGLGDATPTDIAARIINWILGLLTLIAVSLMVYAGMIWMVAGGNEEKVGTAKEILKGALIGVIVILTSYGVTNYVFENLVAFTTQ